ncbi:MAG: metal ABC transporter ATP-binding protein [Kiritimatiellia bacterium]|nr:metal ABC transporter ATP-binding protein [Lentisphaerota bacterium]
MEFSETAGDLQPAPAVLFRNVTVKAAGITILEDVTAHAPAGGCVAIVGPNGAGKTTLLMALLGQLTYAGSITMAVASDGASPRIGYVPQRLQFDRGLPLTVLDFLVMGEQRLPLWLGVRAAARRRALSLLASVRAEMLAERLLGALSGGELQRVLLALALQRDPDLLVLDEPAAGVDLRGGYLLCELLERLRLERGFTQLMVSHDLGTVTHHATHVILLNRRVVAEGPPDAVMTPENLSSVFGLHMGLAGLNLGERHGCAVCRQEDPHA